MSEVVELSALPPAASVDSLIGMIKARRSIRNYTEQKIERAKIDKLFEAGRYTATAVNRQDLVFVLVQDRLDELKKLVWKGVEAVAAGKGGESDAARNFINMYSMGTDYLFRNAPAVMYIATDRPWDAGMAAQNIELAAVAQGLGVLFNGYLTRFTARNDEAMQWLGLGSRKLAACMLVGYPAVHYLRTAPRLPAEARVL
jgi:nitroreductase